MYRTSLEKYKFGAELKNLKSLLNIAYATKFYVKNKKKYVSELHGKQTKMENTLCILNE